MYSTLVIKLKLKCIPFWYFFYFFFAYSGFFAVKCQIKVSGLDYFSWFKNKKGNFSKKETKMERIIVLPFNKREEDRVMEYKIQSKVPVNFDLHIVKCRDYETRIWNACYVMSSPTRQHALVPFSKLLFLIISFWY